MLDIGEPLPAVFDLGALGDRVTGLGAQGTVESKVGLFVPGRWAVGVGGNAVFGVYVFELASGGAGVVAGGGGERAEAEVVEGSHKDGEGGDFVRRRDLMSANRVYDWTGCVHPSHLLY